jgi:DNA (cytosine-5)-methyltransferase 1
VSLTYAGLCEGYGGLTEGVMSVLPGKLLWYSEYDAAPSRILAHHHPGVHNYGDLTLIDWTSLPRVDVLTAGFPCQPFSHAGKRLGANDERHLWPYIQEAIRVLRPRLVVLENVRGLLSGQGEPDTPDIAELAADVARLGRIHHLIKAKLRKAARRGQKERIVRLRADAVRNVGQRKRAVAALRRARAGLVRAIGAVTGGLADVGYDARWYGLRAADVGAPHGRFRIFLFATPADSDLSGLEGRWAGGERAGERPVGPRGVEAGTGGLTLLPTPAVNDMGAAYTPETWDAWTERMKAEHGNGNGHGKSLSIEALRLLPTPTTTQRGTDANLKTREGARANLHNEVAKLLPTPTAADHKASGGSSPSDVTLTDAVVRTDLGRIGNPRLLPTPNVADAVKGGLDHKGGNPTLRGATEDPAREQDWREYEPAVRRWEHVLGRQAPPPTEPGAKGQPRLSPKFVEFMMGLPAGWVTDVPGVSRNDMLKALGNGVVPQQCAAATRAFVQDTAKERAA